MATGKPTFQSPGARQRLAAGRLRREMTDPERILWRAFRDHVPLRGTHLRRQVSLGPFIVDFCCLGERLVIEVDGEQHGWDVGARTDAERESFLRGQGFRILGISNHDVRTALPCVLDTIWAALNDPHFEVVGATPTPSPSPQGGGGQSGAH